MRLLAFFGLIIALALCGVAVPSFAQTPQDTPAVPHTKGALTFTKDVAPIMFAQCASCHRPGEVAPFSLLSYEDVKKRAAQIVAVTQKRQMPPWKANSHGEFRDESRLTDTQLSLLKQWAETGAKEGDRSNLPPLPHFATGWSLGEPEAVFEPAQAYTLGAEGRDEYHTFVIPTNFTEDRFVSAVEVRPGNRTVVHHALIYADAGGKARQRAAANGGADFSGTAGLGFSDSLLRIWAPGNLPQKLPEGIGMRVPKGADIVLEVHYHRSGKPETDKTKVGLYFCKGPVDQQMHVFGLASFLLLIPPGDAHYQTQAEIPVPADATLRNIMPHMHLIGKQMNVTITFPDGKTQTLIDVPDWDFNWQNTYWYKDPIKIPRGSKIKLVARYDNSKDNPHNPNSPPKLIGWGEQTTNEMCFAFLGFTTDNEHLPKKVASSGSAK